MRFLVAILLTLGIGGTAYAAAATLNLDGGVIQFGEDNDLTCTDDARVDGWGLEMNTGEVLSVRLHDIDAACAGQELFINVTDGDTSPLAELGPFIIPTDGGAGDNDPDTGEVGVSSGTFGPVSAASITDVHVGID